MGVGTIGLHEPESIAVVGEDDPFAVRRKFGGIERADSVGQLLQVVSEDIDGINFVIASVS